MDPSQIDLTTRQRQILTAVVNEYRDADSPVKSERIAEIIDRDRGTTQNQLGRLSSVGLVQGTPGPSGGYTPTDAAFELVGGDGEDGETVTLSGNYDRVDVTVDQIRLPAVHHPEECLAHVHFRSAVDDIGTGDAIAVGPTPVANLVVAGEVIATSEAADRVVVDVVRIDAPVTDE
jgi:predicted transcriptional regulator